MLVNDSTRGYGIFIENMLDAVGKEMAGVKLPLPFLIDVCYSRNINMRGGSFYGWSCKKNRNIVGS